MCGFVCFFKQKTAYEMRISDWSSDVCSSDLEVQRRREDDRDQHVDAEDQQVWRALRQQRKTEQQHKNSGTKHLQSGRRRADRVFGLGDRTDLPLRDRKSGGEGKSVSVRVDLGGRRIIKKKTTKKQHRY